MSILTPLPVSDLTPRAPTERVERVVSVGRAFLTVTALIAIYIDPSEPVRLRELTYAVLSGYAVYSLAMWALVHASARLTSVHTRVLHGLDILWTSALTFVSQGPISPFFLFFLFVVLASAYRWGFLETVGTALLTVAIYLAETAISAFGPWSSTIFSTFAFDLNSTILYVSYLLLTGVLLGYLAEQDKDARSELAALAGVARQSHLGLGLGGSVASFGRALLTAFGARSVVVVMKDTVSRRVLQWRVDAPVGTGPSRVQRAELDADAEQAWLFPDAAPTWYAEFPPQAGAAVSALVEVPSAWRLARRSMALPPVLQSLASQNTLTTVNMAFEGEWAARVYVVGPRDRRPERRVHFLRALADHATPALTNVFLLRRLRARAGAVERARVARELHDGAIQSLFAIDMKLEAMRRDPEEPSRLRGDLEQVQGLVRREVTALRELMQALRPVEIESSEQLPDVLATLVERFSRESGIGGRFLASDVRIDMPVAHARELVRIAQEALVNVRKHSGAGQALVRLAATPDACQLAIEDDGRGFAFEGRLSGPELEQRRVGPVVIRERARLIGADVAVESTPGSGARVEVTVPGVAHA